MYFCVYVNDVGGTNLSVKHDCTHQLDAPAQANISSCCLGQLSFIHHEQDKSRAESILSQGPALQ